MKREELVALIAGILKAGNIAAPMDTPEITLSEAIYNADRLVDLAEEQARVNALAEKAKEAGDLPAVPNGFSEWPSIEFAPWMRALGFEDRSYHNDLCGRAELLLEGHNPNTDDGPRLACWVEHEKLEDREEGGPRYQLSFHPHDLNEDEDILYAGDDPEACEAACWRFFDAHPELCGPTKGAKA